MIGRWMLGRLAEHWQGPAINVLSNGRHHPLGTGEPQAEVVIHDPAVLARMIFRPSLAFGEAYMHGDVEVHGDLLKLLEGFYRTYPALAARQPMRTVEWVRRLPHPTGIRRAAANAQHHYDIGNGFYRLWLDPSLTYSCAYFTSDEDDITRAQRQKLELLCRKARLEAGQHILDIGCGWGSLLFHAVEEFGVHATGLTPAMQQTCHIHEQAAQRQLADRIEAVPHDWRQIVGQFDRIISVGMFEHVGREQYRAFFRKWRSMLAPGGLSILHTIGRMSAERGDPWINRYIFPGGYLPTLAQIAEGAAGAGLRVVDVENLAPHYARTLAHWAENYLAVWDKVVDMYDEIFARMWWLYLNGAQAAFRWGGLQLWQVVLCHQHEFPWPLDREVGPVRQPASWIGDQNPSLDTSIARINSSAMRRSDEVSMAECSDHH
jgi:cyclopropane-fatty-acyl-phospholipid synthase